ncbi:zinc finger BED domain-containing protein 6 [Xenopus laevis]|uniref:Zinc finger BED domain-containing protein 6 n=1 Tax=Xenopus laevis TaxID=8355 RepID=A0A8J0VN89_XENLA|nr:zinc finger BED domain-containing protein 6 [Xenopus laevis]XP_041421643.1 zinc finger BED domain-containing protein 6 [Xenopus laevis]
MDNRNDAQTSEAPNQFIPEIEIKLESSDEEEFVKNAASSYTSSEEKETVTLGKVFPGEGALTREVNDVHSQRPTRKRKSTSEVWQFFYRDDTNICRAICGLCRISVSRGKLGGNFGTTALKRHLESKHPMEWAQRKSMKAQRTDGGEEEEDEAIEDEEEKEEPYEKASSAQTVLYSSKPTSETQGAMPISSSQVLNSLKTYQIIDSSDDEGEDYKEGVEQVPVECEEDMDRKRMKMLDQNLRGAFNSCPNSNPHLSMLSGGQTSFHAFNISNNLLVPLGTKNRKSTSAVWQFFSIDRTNICRAICTLCQLSVSRGKQGGHFGTSALMRHLEGKHPLEWARGKINKPKSNSIIEVDEDEEEETDMPLEQIYPQPHVILGIYGSPTHHDTYSTETSGVMTPPVLAMPVEYNREDKERTKEKIRDDLSLTKKEKLALSPSEDLYINGKYAPNHPKAQSWNRNIAELMCGTALPYSFITSKTFKTFMERADPKYCVPSKSFFSGKVVPQIYKAVCERVMNELKRSESYHIHLTTHWWSTGLSMDYLALTAHWAVLQPDNLESIQRKNAVLCTKGFPKDYIDGSIQQELIQQINMWLSQNALIPGFFISCGNLNLIHAIKSANFNYIPCFTHTLNLLVMDFLQNNHYITSLLEVARKVCNHFIHSASARSTLSELQFQNNLPNRPLKLETLPHWTSTFYMLQRLIEQQKAIEEYLESHKLEIADLHLTSSNWSLISCLVELLQPFEMVTREVSASGSCLSQVLPEVRYLHIFLKQIRGHFESKGDVNGVILTDNFTLKISSDFGINEMFQREEYVLSTLLDPRFKGRIEAILPPGSDIDHWKQVLVKKVKEIMSSSLRPAFHFKDSGLESDLLASKNYHLAEEGINSQRRRTMLAPPLIQKEKSLIEHLESVGLLASKSTGASLSTESHSACVMVEKYLQDNQTIGAKEDPLVYWKKRKCPWPALAKLAFMYLTCPPSSIFAERVFTLPCTYGGMQKPSDIMEGMEHFGFLMVNLENFQDYVPPPLIFSSDNEAKQSDSEEG